MHLKNIGLLRLLVVLVVIAIISGCSTTMSNVGRESVKIERIAIKDQKNDDEQWQTNDVLINYSTETTENTFAISGSVHIKDSVTYSFPRGDYFYLFLNFIDKNSIVLSTHDISPLLRYKIDVDASLPINFSLDKPVDAVFFAFSYFGNFRGAYTSDEYMGDWEIYHRPFTKVP